MKKLLYIFLLLPLFVSGQLLGTYVSFGGVENLYDLSNAADPEDEQNNANSTNVESGTDISWSSDSAVKNDGSYSLQLSVDVALTALNRGRIQLTGLTEGETYTITYDFYEDYGNWVVRLETFQGWLTTESNGSGTNDVWQTDLTLTAEAKAGPWYIRIQSPSSTASTGNGIYIDNIRVVKQ